MQEDSTTAIEIRVNKLLSFFFAQWTSATKMRNCPSLPNKLLQLSVLVLVKESWPRAFHRLSNDRQAGSVSKTTSRHAVFFPVLRSHTIRTSSTLITVPTMHIPKHRGKTSLWTGTVQLHVTEMVTRGGILTRLQWDKGQKKNYWSIHELKEWSNRIIQGSWVALIHINLALLKLGKWNCRN